MQLVDPCRVPFGSDGLLELRRCVELPENAELHGVLARGRQAASIIDITVAHRVVNRRRRFHHAGISWRRTGPTEAKLQQALEVAPEIIRSHHGDDQLAPVSRCGTDEALLGRDRPAGLANHVDVVVAQQPVVRVQGDQALRAQGRHHGGGLGVHDAFEERVLQRMREHRCEVTDR